MKSVTQHLGLVCITYSDEIRFKTLTRTRYLKLDLSERQKTLAALYKHNLRLLLRALEFCQEHSLKLYRMSANLFPLSDLEDDIGKALLYEMRNDLGQVGELARNYGIRVVIHPEQFVVLNSERPDVVKNSIKMLENHALSLDFLGLEPSPWTAMNIHGGKGGRAQVLIDTIRRLAPSVKNRLTLENDERAYSAAEILEICVQAGVPMIFDVHHHVVKEGLSSFEDSSIAEFTRLARQTWQPPDWQIVHLSNGREGLSDNKHSDKIHTFPSAFAEVSWIEVEAKAKEEAIFPLREKLRKLS